MKKHIICFLGIVLFGSFILSAQESNSRQQEQLSASAVITIEGMACQEGCADAISANLKKVPGVTSVQVSFATGLANIDFNKNEVSMDDLKAVITNTKVKDYIYTIKEVELTEDN